MYGVIRVDDITHCMPEIKKYFELYIAAEAAADIITLRRSEFIGAHLFLVTTPGAWNYVVPGELPKNFTVIAEEIAAYSAKSGSVIVPVGTLVRGVSPAPLSSYDHFNEGMRYAISLAEMYNMRDPFIIYRDSQFFAFEVVERPRYMLFVAEPRLKRTLLKSCRIYCIRTEELHSCSN